MANAAADLQMTPPAVNALVDRLESHYGVHLIRRNFRANECTREGIKFYDHCKQVLEAVDAAYEATRIKNDVLEDKQIPLEGCVRLASPQCFGETILLPTIAKFHTQYPNLKFDVTLNDRVLNAVPENVDIAFRLGEHPSNDVFTYPLGQANRLLVASPGYLLANGSIGSPQELVRHSFIDVRALFGSGQLPLLDRNGILLTAPISSSVTTNQWRLMYELILAGAGIGVVLESACQDALFEKRLIRLLPDYHIPRLNLTALVSTRSPVSPDVMETISILRRRLPLTTGFSGVGSNTSGTRAKRRRE